LQQAERCVRRLNACVARLIQFGGGRHAPEFDQSLYEARSGWHAAMDNDLNVPQGLGKVFALLRKVNRLLEAGQLDAAQVSAVLDFLRQVNATIAVIDFPQEGAADVVARLIDARNKARKAKDYKTADAIREQLRSLGVRVADSPTGTVWLKY